MFSCEYREIFKNTCFEKHLRTRCLVQAQYLKFKWLPVNTQIFIQAGQLGLIIECFYERSVFGFESRCSPYNSDSYLNLLTVDSSNIENSENQLFIKHFMNTFHLVPVIKCLPWCEDLI